MELEQETTRVKHAANASGRVECLRANLEVLEDRGALLLYLIAELQRETDAFAEVH